MGRRTSPEEETLKELRRLRPFGTQKPPWRRKRRPWVRYTAGVLLALLCVGAAELMACRFFEPALYERLAEPARAAGHQAVQTAGAGLEAACRGARALADRAGRAASAAGNALLDWMEELSAPPPPEAEPLEDGESLEADSALAQPELAPPRELMDPLISDLVERNGQEILTGGGLEVVYFNQTDETRAAQKYGTDPLSTHGCGPTAMAMAVSSLTGETVDPEDMAALCVREGHWCRNHGSYLSLVQGVAEAYGLECRSLDAETVDDSDLYRRLNEGEVLVALMTKGHFTRGGHFILLRGTTLSGEILVADPASRDRSLIPWDLSLILEELSPSRHDGAPLWALSRPAEQEAGQKNFPPP